MIENKGKRLNQYVSDYVVFDLETTGFQYNMDEIIEIAAIKVVNHKIVQQYQTLVHPENHIPSAATAVNGITDEMVKGAPKLEEALKEFLVFIEKHILVGHNIHTFDIKFINHATMQLFDKKIQNDYIDTLYMSRQYLTRLSHHKLVDISKYFHINTMGAHRALNDCIMNQKCYEELGKIMQKTNINQPEILCQKCKSEMIRRKGKYGEFYGCINYPKCKGTQKIMK
ncbi:MAG: topoisomerase DNA-binding C4 zinc finger domain-containing protein [Lachnospiraceae bacterium]